MQRGQVLIYLNRRGFAPVVMCHECGWQSQCHNCDARLTLHQSLQTLLCHHCGYQTAPPRACPSCEAEGRFAACGPGVERLAEEVTALLPGVRLAVLASDTPSGPEAVAGFVDMVERHQVDLFGRQQGVLCAGPGPATFFGEELDVGRDFGPAGCAVLVFAADGRPARRPLSLLYALGHRQVAYSKALR